MAIIGMAQLERKIKALPTAVTEAAAKVLEENAAMLVQQMRNMAPKDTGALAASINWTWGDAPKGAIVLGTVKGDRRKGAGFGLMRITVFAGGTDATKRRQARSSGDRKRDWNRSGYFDTDLARFQEFGTSKMAANPFFYPSYRGLKSIMKGRVTRAVRKAIKDA